MSIPTKTVNRVIVQYYSTVLDCTVQYLVLPGKRRRRTHTGSFTRQVGAAGRRTRNNDINDK